MPRHFAIVPAAGSGARFGAEKPKQYLDLLGRPLIYHTLKVLTASPDIERVWVVLSPDDREWGQHDWSELGPKLETLRCGGATRAESVSNGLQAAAMVAGDDDWVLVHDAARPCLSLAMLDALFSELAEDPVGGILAVPVADTIKRADSEQRVAATEPRDGLWQAQTPQMFRYGQLKKALEMTSNVTDEAGAIEAAGMKPRLVKADSTNLKVTYPADLALAAMILRARK
ncbi:MAG: 2-C-methyl-D-erythritol 4-phosphate cytidylyltransferase [Dechloromonas sp.]|nr:MAG: 2-C-methyl-D-erythritol 4-phosphate cytidylyltransferase [Dechloromonas sp.]